MTPDSGAGETDTWPRMTWPSIRALSVNVFALVLVSIGGEFKVGESWQKNSNLSRG